MTAHIHADLMRQYAEDAAKTDKPWELWQYHHIDRWDDLSSTPGWNLGIQYRRKPPKARFIKIGDRWVPEPMRVAPAEGTFYYTTTEHPTTCVRWVNGYYDNHFLRLGFCHLTPEAAKQHYGALVALNNQEGVER